MYRTNDPRFRRRLNDLSHTLESANESAQSGLYVFGQTYIRPCFQSIGSCLTTCVDASCPSLNLSQREIQRRRARGRTRGRAELSFDFYDDWDDDEGEGLLGWGNDPFAAEGIGGASGYGSISAAQPGWQKGMSYSKTRRKSAVLPHDGGPDPAVIPGTSGFWSRLFGGKGKALHYRPSAADLQEHPGARRGKRRDLTEGEALLEDIEAEEEGGRGHRRARSGTQTTTSSYSSRGDIFPSDGELDDAIPLDDEFAMVLERRTTQSQGERSGPETESSSGKTRRNSSLRRGKRPSNAASRRSTNHSASNRSIASGRKSSATVTPVEEVQQEEIVPSLLELKQEERQVEEEEEAMVERRRSEAQRVAADRGLVDEAIISSKEATPQASSPVVAPATTIDEPSQLPTPLATDDEEEDAAEIPNNDDNKDTRP
ncbi:hypothetical protein CLAFUW4_10407 [Fulvia fulva]|uniref:Uncharacterized protein n=1 Tax=Passalora fulva TaxID=5499 RepID=A0A9Q8P7C5_PASFU|nr:uncharacterized protein CLAFUR5_05022 [Fulvia fulva]KAK4616049.1 hypothetical protein CLAFUR4_10411 [Fulvia fulva]KAK4617312.1 hypothetical protein CLAFUR0_10412 [Fulvia fulva]UJO15752.1 hypothetical protein CLAFUR5_05022 [Fulvia fulva]WPV18942.1 hypothetical protein CLAFUW4_10407 [Fulvia fulva]WPV34218.1 hypothetical protein CLAFUW7_10407 [Fulvia fulva]